MSSPAGALSPAAPGPAWLHIAVKVQAKCTSEPASMCARCTLSQQHVTAVQHISTFLLYSEGACGEHPL